MIRDRAWRRHMEEKVLIKRLKRKCVVDHWWRGFEDVNGINYSKRTVSTYIGTKDYFWSKTLSTTKWDTRYKCKYSPNKFGGYSRDPKSKGNSYGLREKDKSLFFKILKENGIR